MTPKLAGFEPRNWIKGFRRQNLKINSAISKDEKKLANFF